MKHTFKYFLTVMVLAGGIFMAALPASGVGAIDVFQSACPGGGSGATSGGGAQSTGGSGAPAGSTSSLCGAAASDSAPDIVKNVINTMLYVLGIIAVIMIVIGGVRYTTSNGDASQTKAAKDTILYAVIGLIVAIMAFAIVNFVVKSFK